MTAQSAFDKAKAKQFLARFQGDLTAAICFFAADESSYITGQTLYVAGGCIG